MALRKIKAITFGLGLQLPAEYFYQSQDQFRELAHQLTQLLSGWTKGEQRELGLRTLQLISALFNQYPFLTRSYRKNGGTAWYSDPKELFKDFDRKKIDRWIDDITWLEALLVPAVALMSKRISWLLEQVETDASAFFSFMRAQTSQIHPSSLADMADISKKMSFVDVPRLFAEALREAKGVGDEVRRLLMESDNAKRTIPKRPIVGAIFLFALAVFVGGVAYPLLICSGVEPRLGCLCDHPFPFELFCLYLPWIFFLGSATLVLWPALRQKYVARDLNRIDAPH